MSKVILEAHDVWRWFDEGDSKLEVLKGVDFTLLEGEVVAFTGASGAGKSTFLNILGSLDKPNKGKILCRDKNIAEFSPNELDLYRQKDIGFVFQFHHLMPDFNALDNVALPARIAGKSEEEAQQLASDMLKRVGLGQRMKHLPSELSGGERQRAAVARALINRPAVVMADEPSGNLDEANSKALHRLFTELNQEYNQTFLIVTHDPSLAETAHRVVHMENGLVVSI